MKIRSALIAGAAAFVIVLVSSHLRATPFNNYVLLADAFLHGHAWINWPGPYIDALLYNGQHYIIEAPLPALLLLPAVAIFGTAVSQTLLAALLAAVAIGAAWELTERLGVARRASIWLCIFLLAGTDLLWCAMLGDVWFIAHVSAVCFTLLALVELTGKRRGWLVAVWAACAIESRFSLALALPAYAYLLALPQSEEPFLFRDARARLIGFAAILIPIGLLWVGYNELRWGTFGDIGYTAWYHQDAAGMPYGSPFQLQYLPYQLYSFFVQLPTFTPSYPYVRPEIVGIALTWTSPALVLAFLARRPSRLVIAFWAATILVAAPSFVYYVNGFSQFGMRHALDFEPFLFALMALGVRAGFPIWGRVLVAYSAVVGVWGVWFWNAIVRAGS
ncbi:MAG: hypothetical protein M3Y21_00745 [Candidatus Eremiobacteraeota bacterium]|nr:hypothetical protein [Candidatus Eremiobacteraeota bacterium]